MRNNKEQFTSEELLAGGSITYEIKIPDNILFPHSSKQEKETNTDLKIQKTVTLRPLVVNDINMITKAAKHDYTELPSLMIQASLMKPELDYNDIKKMHFGLANFLVTKINEISGMEASANF